MSAMQLSLKITALISSHSLPKIAQKQEYSRYCTGQAHIIDSLGQENGLVLEVIYSSHVNLQTVFQLMTRMNC